MLELKHIKKIYNPGTISETLLFEDFNLTVPMANLFRLSAVMGRVKPPC